ncbi:MAG: hypothetical protein ACE15F_15630 [bacterium]
MAVNIRLRPIAISAGNSIPNSFHVHREKRKRMENVIRNCTILNPVGPEKKDWFFRAVRV